MDFEADDDFVFRSQLATPCLGIGILRITDAKV